MKSTLYLFMLLLICRPAFTQTQRLARIIAEADVPGIQLVYTNNNTSHIYNMGLEKDGAPHKVSSGTIFEAASLSKTVFAYAVLRLYDKGLISLDSPLLGYLGGAYERFTQPNPDYAKITARMVLRHTSGLPGWGTDSGAVLQFKPDSCFSYSGEGYWFLQRAVEQVTGKPLNTVMQQEVFTPLGMKHSSYVWNRYMDAAAAKGLTGVDKNRHRNANAAFSLTTNARDFNIFLQALLRGKGLQPATHRMMMEKASAANRFDEKESPADAYIDWGLGIGLQQNEKGKAIWHWGDNGDYKCFFMAFPDSRESLVYFTHDRNGLDMMADILHLFFGRQTAWATQWLSYGYKHPLVIRDLRRTLLRRGYENAMAVVNEKKQKDPGYQLTKHDLNTLGYVLLNKGKKKEAVEIFKLNIQLFPFNWNNTDSREEAYEAPEDSLPGIEDHVSSLELSPGKGHAEATPNKLKQP
ncbi:serine hydrolase domain-containing protein [uncultured Chitinophaga sp.]|jgi:Beta-lactamase class C and other penicillin binding proteins|uniref:serine hydrolase domain-containing protein n=1 Tax=uncultured Chitinophaga sp. TaxID=339340 RepID=UPI002617EEEF|nr:serine hydrolase domain-containing protein [uncultured Chitinophaga sp.]